MKTMQKKLTRLKSSLVIQINIDQKAIQSFHQRIGNMLFQDHLIQSHILNIENTSKQDNRKRKVLQVE